MHLAAPNWMWYLLATWFVTSNISWSFLRSWCIRQTPGGVLPMWWVIHICRSFDPLFSLWQDRARSFWGVFSHPPTQKWSFGYKSSQNSIFLAPKYHFSLDLFGSNFQWPAAHTQQFSDRVPPPGGQTSSIHSSSESSVMFAVLFRSLAFVVWALLRFHQLRWHILWPIALLLVWYCLLFFFSG